MESKSPNCRAFSTTLNSSNGGRPFEAPGTDKGIFVSNQPKEYHIRSNLYGST